MKLLRPLLQRLISYTIKPALSFYLLKPRKYRYQQFNLTILPGVFHPAFFFSTQYLLSFLQKNNFIGKSVVEIGAGNGLISFYLSTCANKVVAVELSQTAINGLIINLQNNRHLFPQHTPQILKSNLFESLEPFHFDCIVVNPPFFPKKVNSEAQLAWHCGEDFEYFKNFFNQAASFMHKQSAIIMVLADVCDINSILSIATNHGFTVKLMHQKNFLIEHNFIYQFNKST